MPEKRCFCVRCTEEGGFNGDGQPIGVLINTRHLTAHKLRVAREEAERREAQAISPSPVQSAELHAQMLALTLADDGPDVDNLPSKLWTSCVHLHGKQQEQPPPPDLASPMPIDAIVESITGFALPDLDCGELQQSSPDGPTSRNAKCETKTSKKERSRHTTKALAVLNSIQSQIQRCYDRLSNPPTTGLLSEIESTVSRLRHGVENVRRQTPSLDTRKREVLQHLNNLEARIIELKIITPAAPPEGPLSYDSGENAFDNYDITDSDIMQQTIITEPQSIDSTQ